MRGILLIGAAALALAACQKSPTAGAEQTAGSEQAAATPAATPLGGAPHRRSGLWEQTMTLDGKTLAMGMGDSKVCVDDAMEAKASGMFKTFGPMGQPSAGANCTHDGPNRGPDGSWTFSSTCKTSNGGQVTSSGKVSGDFSSSYHIDLTSDTTGARFEPMNGHHSTQLDGKWLGPCPAGMAGGDMQMANGMTISGGKVAGAAKMLGGAAGGAAPAGQ